MPYSIPAIGQVYYEGEVPKKSINKAKYYYAKAAEICNHDARTCLACLEDDPERKIKLWIMAARARQE